jgi:hypothetical protein
MMHLIIITCAGFRQLIPAGMCAAASGCGARNEGIEMTSLEQCQAQVFVSGQCSEEATAKVRGGCRHEHIKEKALCFWHAEDILQSDSAGVCLECYELGHDCAVRAVIVEEWHEFIE